MNNFEDLEKRIIKELSKKIYFNMSISYKEFLNLYEPYKSIIEEEEFAKILGITYDNWQSIKNRGTRTKIKATRLNKEISDMRINQIIGEIRSKGFEDTVISYAEFLHLYEAYKTEMSEPDFAQVLGITYTNWSNMRHANSKARILKPVSKHISEERVNEIKQEIIKKGYANKLISYEELLQLYEPFKEEITESDFAQLLGITYLNWNNMRGGKRRVRILKTVDETLDNKKIRSSKTSSFEEQQMQLEMQIQENSTPIDVMQMCLQAGMKRNQTLKYCMDKFSLTKTELLKMITQCLQDKKTSKNVMKENRNNKDIGENKGSDNKCI